MYLPPEISKFNFKSKLGYVALRAFFRICKDWNTTVDEQCRLLKVGLIELERLRKLPPEPLDRDKLVRIRCFVLTYKAMVAEHGSVAKANREMRAPRRAQPFVGKTPLQLMLNGGIIGIASACKALAGEVPEIEPPVAKAS
ncbi:hypothetical protein [Marinobacter sp. P4B1]|uniref:hypothetical protein n=1 Tax=Marinobacter sp. P4B1 TaxID=1119533 RepID=UPI00071D78E2|nr:hypothetical protein [Marinobacter sp. P4B1]KRW83701.1 hypothetical protein AQ621_16765 [Marinobacter sp. P4B1]